jgi:hypothetical protein
MLLAGQALLKILSVSACWNDMYEQLLDYKQEYGNVKVPQGYDENPKLGRWVMTNRTNYREYKRSNGQKGDPGVLSLGDINFTLKEGYTNLNSTYELSAGASKTFLTGKHGYGNKFKVAEVEVF